MIKYSEVSAIEFWQNITPFELLDFKFSPFGEKARRLEDENGGLTLRQWINITLEYLNDCQNS